MMAQANFDTESFHAALDSQRMAMNLTWKDVAAESGVSASTLTRMSQGKRPDVDGLAALLKWSGLLAENFYYDADVGKPEPLAQITMILRGDKRLSAANKRTLEN